LFFDYLLVAKERKISIFEYGEFEIIYFLENADRNLGKGLYLEA